MVIVVRERQALERARRGGREATVRRNPARATAPPALARPAPAVPRFLDTYGCGG
jgi:hypothetical protein